MAFYPPAAAAVLAHEGAAYVNDPKKPRSLSGPSFCIHGGDKVTLVVTYEGFKVQYP